MVLNTYNFKIAHPNDFKQFSVRDILYVYYKCPQLERWVQLFTHYNEIAFTLNGGKTFHQAGNSWRLTENSGLFFRKTAYTQEMEKSYGWELLAFYFQDSFLKQVFEEYREELPTRHLPEVPTEMIIAINFNESSRTCCYSIIPYFNQKKSPSESMLVLKLKELLFNLLSDPGNAHFLSYVNTIANQSKIPIWQVMEANYMYNLKLVDYASISSRSMTTFKRDFFDYYQTTPGKWLTEKRLNRAKLLLSTSDKSISDIALDSGFENISHFSRTFKEWVGASPLQYRKEEHSLRLRS